MKSPELGAWPPNDSQSPQGQKPKSPFIRPILNGHDLQPLLVFKMCIFKKKTNLVDYFSNEGVLRRLRIALLLEWVKFKIFRTIFQIGHKEISFVKYFFKSWDFIAYQSICIKGGLTSFNSFKDFCSWFRTKGKEILNAIKEKSHVILLKCKILFWEILMSQQWVVTSFTPREVYQERSIKRGHIFVLIN